MSWASGCPAPWYGQISHNLHYKKIYNHLLLVIIISVVATGTCIRQSCPVLPPWKCRRLRFINLEQFTSHMKYNFGMLKSFNWLILEFELCQTSLKPNTVINFRNVITIIWRIAFTFSFNQLGKKAPSLLCIALHASGYKSMHSSNNM